MGLAFFSMFFGAGNLIFPLALGRQAGTNHLYALSGLLLTAVLIPILGVIAMILFQGNTRSFFGRLGRIPGSLLALLIISLLGPLGSTPRCLLLAYATLKSSSLELPPLLFSALACGVLFLCTFRKERILPLLGWVLTPLLLGSLITILLLGWLSAPPLPSEELPPFTLFFAGLKEGYNTMDLLASFFFSSTLLTMLNKRQGGSSSNLRTALWGSIIGALLLGGVYVGLSALGAWHGASLPFTAKEELLGAIVMRIAGSGGGLLICFTIALACFTTAIALLSASATFIHQEIFREKISYEYTLLGILLVTFALSTCAFTGIAAFLTPLLQICYPGLILLTILNIIFHFKNFKPIKFPVFFAFIVSLYLYFF